MEDLTIKKGVEQVVNEIYHSYGGVKPSTLVDAARPTDSPAHNAFEWKDDVAGEQYRLWQARQWIRRVEIIVDDRPERMVNVPLIKSEFIESDDREGIYKPISIVAANEDDFKNALSATYSKLKAARLAYNDLKSAAENAKTKKPDFKRADRGFDMVERALTV